MIFYTIFIGQTEINKTISLLKKCFIYKVLDITFVKTKPNSFSSTIKRKLLN